MNIQSGLDKLEALAEGSEQRNIQVRHLREILHSMRDGGEDKYTMYKFTTIEATLKQLHERIEKLEKPLQVYTYSGHTGECKEGCGCVIAKMKEPSSVSEHPVDALCRMPPFNEPKPTMPEGEKKEWDIRKEFAETQEPKHSTSWLCPICNPKPSVEKCDCPTCGEFIPTPLPAEFLRDGNIQISRKVAEEWLKYNHVGFPETVNLVNDLRRALSKDTK